MSRLLLTELQQDVVSQKDSVLGAAGTNPAVPNKPAPSTREQRSPGCGDPAATVPGPPAVAAALPLGTRVRNKRTDELATVIVPRYEVRKGEVALEYDGDESTQWNTPLSKVEVVPDEPDGDDYADRAQWKAQR